MLWWVTPLLSSGSPLKETLFKHNSVYNNERMKICALPSGSKWVKQVQTGHLDSPSTKHRPDAPFSGYLDTLVSWTPIRAKMDHKTRLILITCLMKIIHDEDMYCQVTLINIWRVVYVEDYIVPLRKANVNWSSIFFS